MAVGGCSLRANGAEGTLSEMHVTRDVHLTIFFLNDNFFLSLPIYRHLFEVAPFVRGSVHGRSGGLGAGHFGTGLGMSI